MVNFEQVKLKPDAKEELNIMLSVMKSTLKRKGYEATYSGLIHYLFDSKREEMEMILEHKGLRIDKIRLSELQRGD